MFLVEVVSEYVSELDTAEIATMALSDRQPASFLPYAPQEGARKARHAARGAAAFRNLARAVLLHLEREEAKRARPLAAAAERAAERAAAAAVPVTLKVRLWAGFKLQRIYCKMGTPDEKIRLTVVCTSYARSRGLVEGVS